MLGIDVSSALGDDGFGRTGTTSDDLVIQPLSTSNSLRFDTKNGMITATLSNHDPNIPEAYHFEVTSN